MNKAIIGFIILTSIVLCGCNNNGRYKLSTAENGIYLLDSKTGKIWYNYYMSSSREMSPFDQPNRREQRGMDIATAK